MSPAVTTSDLWTNSFGTKGILKYPNSTELLPPVWSTANRMSHSQSIWKTHRSKKSWTIWYRRGRIGLGGTVWFMGIILGWGTRTQTGLEAWKGTVFTLRRIVLLRSMRFSTMPCSGALLTLLAIKRPVKGPELEANWSEEGHRAKRAKLIRMGLRRYRRSAQKALF